MTHLVPVLRPVLGSPFRRASLYRAAGEMPSWHIAPVRTGTVTDLISGSQIITFTNSSPAWGFNSSGVLVQPAANVPFIEYDPATGAALGWRIWGLVLNSVVRSEEFDNASWSKSNVTITANNAVAPTGATTADKLVETTANAAHLVWQSRAAQNETVTFSVFCKAAERTHVQLELSNFATAAIAAVFNLSTGTVVSLGAANADYTNPLAGVINCGGGIYRCFLTATKGTANNNNIPTITLHNGTTTSYAGNGTSGIHIFGAQVNPGPLAPYVPTAGLAASSTADVASITGAAFAGIWNQAAGTLYASVIMAEPTKSGNQFIIRASDNGYNNTVNLNVQSGFPSISTSAGGVFDGTATSAQSLTTAAANFAGAYAANDLALAYANATVTDSTATMPSNLTRIDFGADHNGLNRATGVYVREAAIFKSRRPNTNLQSMTQ
jgi:hypothetical protein